MYLFNRYKQMSNEAWDKDATASTLEQSMFTVNQTDCQTLERSTDALKNFETWKYECDKQIKIPQNNLTEIEKNVDMRFKEEEITHTMAGHMHLITSTNLTKKFLFALNIDASISLLSASIATAYIGADSQHTLEKLRDGTHAITTGVPQKVLLECYQRAAALAGQEWIAKVILCVPTQLLLTDKPHEAMHRTRPPMI